MSEISLEDKIEMLDRYSGAEVPREFIQELIVADREQSKLIEKLESSLIRLLDCDWKITLHDARESLNLIEEWKKGKA